MPSYVYIGIIDKGIALGKGVEGTVHSKDIF